MKAKLIYTECRETSFGYGNEYKTSILEINGIYYQVDSKFSFNENSTEISRMDFDLNNLPKEYSRMEYQQHCWLQHGNYREVEIDLTQFDKVPEELEDIKKLELDKKRVEKQEKANKEKLKRKEELQKYIESNPLYSEEYIIGNPELSNEEKEKALKLRERVIAEVRRKNEEKLFNISRYDEIFERISDIASGKAIITVHSDSHYYQSPRRLDY